jgi:hypothetical protein
VHRHLDERQRGDAHAAAVRRVSATAC